MTVSKGDSVVVFAVIPPNYRITLPSAGNYEISIAHIGYAPYSVHGRFLADTTLVAVLQPKTFELDEVVVEGKAARTVTATGEIFRLSQKAKKSGDPFRALSEIPLLNVDIVNQRVTTNAGEPLLVLIDGRLQNSGIQPIDPKFIDRVEISEVVSARFLKLGVRKILNIRLKKERPLYVYTDIRTRHDMPLREGFGGANFEVGSKKFAVSGSAFYTYLHNDKTEFEQRETSGNVSRAVSSKSTYGLNQWDGSAFLKWVPNEADYVSFGAKGQYFSKPGERHSEGEYVGETSYPLLSDYSSSLTSKGYLSGLYHEHTFKNKSILTTYLQFNSAGAVTDDRLHEQYNREVHDNVVNYDTWRHQYIASVDFDTQEQSYGDVGLGNRFEYILDWYRNFMAPPSLRLYTHLWNNYTYASYSNSWRKLFYMASAGLENLGVRVEGHTHVSWRPRISASATWQLPRRQMWRFAYNLDNTLPESMYLNTFNTSTNPMLREEGNPDLVPEQSHNFYTKYDVDVKRVRLSLVANYTRQWNIIEPYIFSDGEAQVRSYRNNGTYKETSVSGGATYNGKNFTMSLAATRTWKSFNGLPTKALVGVNGYLRWDFGKFFIYSTLKWKNKEYTPLATVSYDNPIDAHVQIAWYATKNLYLSLALPYYWGVRSQTVNIDQPAYKIWQDVRYTGMSMRPWLLISWTLRKNAKEALPNKLPIR